MGYVASYVLPDGRVGEKYFSSREELEEFKRRGAKLYNIREKRYVKRVYTDRYGRVHEELVDTRTGERLPVPIERRVDDVLRGKYGVSLEELQRIVATSKSQPEAIAKLRKRLHGSTKYDPRFYEVENLLNQLYDAKEHSYIPGVKEKAARTIRSLVVRHTPGARVENGKIVVGGRELEESRRLLTNLMKSTTHEAVPKPQLKPSFVAKKVSITSTTPKPQPATVHVSQAKFADYRKLGMYALGAVVAFLVLKKVLR